MNRRLLILLSALMAGALLVAACGGGGGGSATKDTKATSKDTKGAAAKADVTVDMVAGNKYDPAAVTIQKGQTVQWVNKDSQVHDVKFQQGESSPNVMQANATWSRTFSDAGTFPYICTYHEAEGMTGTVTVQ
jgi:plastocyanin